MYPTKEEIASVKGKGFLLNRQTGLFSGRVVSVGGVYSAAQLKALAECAETLGCGRVSFTSRQSAEIVGLPFDKLDQASSLLAEVGLEFGGTGPKIRPVTACKGTTCVYGNLDTQAMAAVLHERFYLGMRSVKLPHKFKIGVGGCPNSCIKPSLNDVGVEGRKIFTFDASLCKGCTVCAVEQKCPSHAVSRKDGTAVIDSGKCLHCGVCIGKCPFGAFPKEAESGCVIYAGGTWGKTRRDGTPLRGLYPAEQAPELVEKIILWYRENAYTGERLGAAIDRIGMEQFEKDVLEGDLSERKDEILAAPLKIRP